MLIILSCIHEKSNPAQCGERVCKQSENADKNVSVTADRNVSVTGGFHYELVAGPVGNWFYKRSSFKDDH